MAKSKSMRTKLGNDVHVANMFQRVNEDMRSGRIINAHEWLVKLKEYIYKEYGDTEARDV